MEQKNLLRVLLAGVIIVSAIPLVITASTYEGEKTVTSTNITDSVSPNTTFVSLQGSENGFGGGVAAIDPKSNQVIWTTSQLGWAYDVDIVNESTILVVGRYPKSHSGRVWHLFMVDWRANRTLQTYPVPPGTHNVDYLGDGRYLVAAKGSFHNESRINQWMALAKSRGWLPQDREEWHSRLYIVN